MKEIFENERNISKLKIVLTVTQIDKLLNFM